MSIYTDDFSPDQATERHPFNLMLDRINDIVVEDIADPDNPDSTIRVARVGAGAWLGPDPVFAGTSSERPNLIQYLRERNLALDVVGGITHQSVAGFVSTGSAGASVIHDFGGALLAFEVVDGEGNIATLERSPKGAGPDAKRDNPFYALGTSMGLLGIVTRVTVKVVPAFLEEFLRRTAYSRLLWWPQKGVDLVQVWECERVEQSKVHEPHKQFDDPLLEQHLIILLYQGVLPFLARGEWDKVLEGLEKLKRAVEAVFAGISSADGAVSAAILAVAGAADAARAAAQAADLAATAAGNALETLGQPSVASPLVTEAIVAARDAANQAARAAVTAEELKSGIVEAAAVGAVRIQQLRGALATLGAIVEEGIANKAAESAYEKALALIIPLFMEPGSKPFSDTWWHGIPDDNQVSDKLVPVTFTELWLPLSRAAKVMSRLRELYRQLSPVQRGSFCVELYAGPPSEFWMSPAFGSEPVFRVDIFVLQDGPEWDHRDGFYEPYWNLLREFAARFHWGKRLSPVGSATGIAYRQQILGRQLTDFLRLRATRDPHNVFLSTYWREHLGISGVPHSASEAV
jgi:hypothetical protein